MEHKRSILQTSGERKTSRMFERIYMIEFFNEKGEKVMEQNLGADSIGDLLIQIDKTFHMEMMCATKEIVALRWTQL